MNTWYVLAKKDKRYKYDFVPVFNRSHVFTSLHTAKKVKRYKEKELKKELIILERTCKPLKRI